MYTLIFRLPENLVQDDNYISVCYPKTRTDERRWLSDIKDELVDEYGADDPDEFELVCIIPKEVEVTFESDIE